MNTFAQSLSAAQRELLANVIASRQQALQELEERVTLLKAEIEALRRLQTPTAPSENADPGQLDSPSTRHDPFSSQPSRRNRNKPKVVVSAVQKILRQVGAAHTRELLEEHLAHEGIEIQGAKPSSNLYNLLNNRPGLFELTDEGWVLTEHLPPEGESAASAEADSGTAPDTGTGGVPHRRSEEGERLPQEDWQ